MEENIENFIEELTKVRPEMLNEEALKLFNTILAVLDERDKLIKENKELKAKIDVSNWHEKSCREIIDSKYIPKSKIKEIRDKAEVMDYYMLNDVIDDLNKLLGDEENE